MLFKRSVFYHKKCIVLKLRKLFIGYFWYTMSAFLALVHLMATWILRRDWAALKWVEWANLRKCNWSEWTFQDTKGTVRRTTLEFGEPPRSPITTYSKKKPVALQLAVCTQARHGSWGRLEPFSEEPFVFSAKHILPKISTFHWKAIVLSMETNFFS